MLFKMIKSTIKNLLKEHKKYDKTFIRKAFLENISFICSWSTNSSLKYNYYLEPFLHDSIGIKLPMCLQKQSLSVCGDNSGFTIPKSVKYKLVLTCLPSFRTSQTSQLLLTINIKLF